MLGQALQLLDMGRTEGERIAVELLQHAAAFFCLFDWMFGYRRPSIFAVTGALDLRA
jgi:hypothetical protein